MLRLKMVTINIFYFIIGMGIHEIVGDTDLSLLHPQDSTWYELQWILPDPQQEQKQQQQQELHQTQQQQEHGLRMMMRTEVGERYMCVVRESEVAGEQTQSEESNKHQEEQEKPEEKNKEQGDSSEPREASAIEVMRDLHQANLCTKRVESFWMYDLCHGTEVRQASHQKQGGGALEYVLGSYSRVFQPGREEVSVDLLALTDHMPYVLVEYEAGTHCHLVHTHRRATVIYYCPARRRRGPARVEVEVVRVIEVATCVYQVVVALTRLCALPSFGAPLTPHRHLLTCQPLDGAPTHPRGLTQVMRGDLALYPREVLRMSTEERWRQFVAGRHCVAGGSGYWSHELCYGRHVLQYHEERGEKRGASITLGRWDEREHRRYLEEEGRYRGEVDERREKQGMVRLMYMGGDVCDVTGKERRVEVKLRCVEGRGGEGADDTVVVLSESKTCEYSMRVESSMICNLIHKVDEYGVPILLTQ